MAKKREHLLLTNFDREQTAWGQNPGVPYSSSPLTKTTGRTFERTATIPKEHPYHLCMASPHHCNQPGRWKLILYPVIYIITAIVIAYSIFCTVVNSLFNSNTHQWSFPQSPDVLFRKCTYASTKGKKRGEREKWIESSLWNHRWSLLSRDEYLVPR